MELRKKNRLFHILKNDSFFLEKLVKDFKEEIGTKEKELLTQFPFFDLFVLNTNIGEEFEKFIEAYVFNDFHRVTNEDYDGKVYQKKVEVKIIRMVTKKEIKNEENYNVLSEVDIPSRAKSFFEKDKTKNLQNRTFQQVKPASFDYMIGLAIFRDAIEVFIIPSQDIAPKVKMDKASISNQGKIYLTGQHKGNEEEGQINYSDLEKYKKIVITGNLETKELFYQEIKKTKDLSEKQELPISLLKLIS